MTDYRYLNRRIIKRPDMLGNQRGWKGGRRINARGYVDIFMPNHPRANPNGYVPEHILIAEKVLGHSFDRSIKVHHVDGDRTNNNHNNLVICNESLHKIIHHRTKALKESGNPNNIKCSVCNKYSNPANMIKYLNSLYHPECQQIIRKKKLVYWKEYNKCRKEK